MMPIPLIPIIIISAIGIITLVATPVGTGISNIIEGKSFDASSTDSGDFGIKETVDEVFDYLDQSLTQSVKDTNIDPDENLLNTSEEELSDLAHSGTEAGKSAVQLFVNLHNFIVDGLIALSPTDIDRATISLLAGVITFIAFWLILSRFMRHGLYIAIGAGILVGAFLMFGSNISF